MNLEVFHDLVKGFRRVRVWQNGEKLVQSGKGFVNEAETAEQRGLR